MLAFYGQIVKAVIKNCFSHFTFHSFEFCAVSLTGSGLALRLTLTHFGFQGKSPAHIPFTPIVYEEQPTRRKLT